ncbi:MAG: ABC transporter ATP-binding protein [Nitrospiraceae bacterium]|nr:ABC transporter ATP-binding protein [Nitrospiraceae bacterium]
MIEVRELTKTYVLDGQVFKAVDNVSFVIGRGEMASIIGHSGSGKTTLLSLIGGLTKPASGSVLIEGKAIWSMSDDELSGFRNRKMNFIYQFSSLVPTLTALENILLPTAFGDHGENLVDYARELLGVVGLTEKENSYPSHLSGGQQRRIAIARAFINKPDIVLADEPTGDLDEDTENEIIALFNRMNKDAGTTFVIVTHNKEIAALTGHQLKMANGIVSDISRA